jgi:hypothetical protein
VRKSEPHTGYCSGKRESAESEDDEESDDMLRNEGTEWTTFGLGAVLASVVLMVAMSSGLIARGDAAMWKSSMVVGEGAKGSNSNE